MSHTVIGRCLHIAEDRTRTEDPKPYKVLQMLSDSQGLIHRINADVIQQKEGQWAGKRVMITEVQSNGGRFIRIDRLVDPLCRKLSGSVTVYARPQVCEKNGSPILFYVLTEDQKSPDPIPTGDLFPKGIKDYANRPWETGLIEVPVRVKTFRSKSGLGLDYIALGDGQ